MDTMFTDVVYEIVINFYRPAVYKTILFASLLVSLVACSSSSGSSGDDGGSFPVRSSFSVQLDESGRASTTIDVGPNTTSLQIFGAVASGAIRVTSVQAPNPSTTAVLQRDLARSYGNLPLGRAAAINLPMLNDIGDLPEGSYRIGFEALESESRSISVSALAKQDSDLGSGTIPVNLILHGSLVNFGDTRSQLEFSFGVVQEIFDRADLKLELNVYDNPAGPDILPDPKLGDPMYEAMSSTLPKGVNVHVALYIDPIDFSNNVLASAGSVPGTFEATPHSAIAAGIFVATGDDFQFDTGQRVANEARLFAEGIGHEILHYLGLADTVLFEGEFGNVLANDQLDSAKCVTEIQCRRDRLAAQNIMFPLVVNSARRADTLYEPRQFFSEMQVQVAQRSALVR